MKFTKIVSVVLIFTSFIGCTYAAKPGIYVGGGLGYSSLENFSDATRKNGGGLGGQLFAGYNFNKYLGIEAGYRTYAKTNYEIDEASYLTFDYTMNALTLVGKGYLPISDNSPFNLYALLGFAEVHGTGDVRLLGASTLISSSNNALLATGGLGISYDINSHVTANCEYTATQGKSGDSDHIGIPRADLATLNIAYNFG